MSAVKETVSPLDCVPKQSSLSISMYDAYNAYQEYKGSIQPQKLK